MKEVILTVKNLKKYFRRLAVLENVNFSLLKGEVFGLIGLNGSGKTTLLRCILGLLQLTGGEVLFFNQKVNPDIIRNNFSFLPESFSPPLGLKGREFLSWLGFALGCSKQKPDLLLKRFALKEAENRLCRSYSRGMVQRLGLAACLLKDPQLIILDEPTLGLDPWGQWEIINLLKSLKKQGKTILLSSHILSHIDELCDKIGVLWKGFIKFLGPPEQLKTKHKTASLEEAFLKEVEIKRNS